MEKKQAKRTGRKPKTDPADYKYSFRLNAQEKSRFEKLFLESGARDRTIFIKKSIFSEQLKVYLRKGDILVVYKFDRLGRSLSDLLNIISELHEKGVEIMSLKDNIDTSSTSGKLMMHIFASLAEFERDLIIERTQAGRKAAMARGKKMGRPKLKRNKRARAAAMLYAKGMGIDDIQSQLNIKSKSTVYRYLRLEGIEPSRKPYLCKSSTNKVSNKEHIDELSKLL